MDVEERKSKEGGKDEGRKVTRSDRERETGMGRLEKMMSSVRDAAEPPLRPCRRTSVSAGQCVRGHTCCWTV